MKVSILKNESKEIIVEFDDKDLTIPELIAVKLNENDDVGFAAVDQEHPEVSNPKLVLKTEKKKAADVLEKTVDEIEEDFADIKTQISKKK